MPDRRGRHTRSGAAMRSRRPARVPPLLLPTLPITDHRRRGGRRPDRRLCPPAAPDERRDQGKSSDDRRPSLSDRVPAGGHRAFPGQQPWPRRSAAAAGGLAYRSGSAELPAVSGRPPSRHGGGIAAVFLARMDRSAARRAGASDPASARRRAAAAGVDHRRHAAGRRHRLCLRKARPNSPRCSWS
jgi:hypothetical protein